MTIAILDADSIIYAAASVGEERFIEVTHMPTGRMNDFKNKTTFYGKKKDKSDGWLGDLNKTRIEKGSKPFDLSEFEIVEKQRVKEKIENILHTTKIMVASSVEAVGADTMCCFVGSNKTPLFRWQQSTMLEYKGNRKELLSPLLKPDVTEYILKHQNGILIEDGHEADDWVVIEALREKERGERAVVISVDKDTNGNPVLFYNPNHPEWGVQDGDCFGNLHLDDKGKVRGLGRLFKYFQISSGDTTDNFKTNSHSDVKWAEKGAYERLKDVQNDKDAWKVMYEIMLHLYPEPKIITGWRGDEFEIDALYVMQEMWNCAHMKRDPVNDNVVVKDVLKKYKII